MSEERKVDCLGHPCGKCQSNKARYVEIKFDKDNVICPKCGHVSARYKGVEFASQEQIEYLNYYIQQVLDVVAEVVEIPGIKNAWVSDRSSIGDFFLCKDREVCSKQEYCICNFTGELKEISENLGIEVVEKTFLIDIAKKLVGM